ncbi:hypothetical protein J6590_053510 [Homalodisca vitripennis]|nr:hypothetical protein J6590_053510 [Homalodisca vitripennis]
MIGVVDSLMQLLQTRTFSAYGELVEVDVWKSLTGHTAETSGVEAWAFHGIVIVLGFNLYSDSCQKVAGKGYEAMMGVWKGFTGHTAETSGVEAGAFHGIVIPGKVEEAIMDVWILEARKYQSLNFTIYIAGKHDREQGHDKAHVTVSQNKDTELDSKDLLGIATINPSTIIGTHSLKFSFGKVFVKQYQQQGYFPSSEVCPVGMLISSKKNDNRITPTSTYGPGNHPYSYHPERKLPSETDWANLEKVCTSKSHDGLKQSCSIIEEHSKIMPVSTLAISQHYHPGRKLPSEKDWANLEKVFTSKSHVGSPCNISGSGMNLSRKEWALLNFRINVGEFNVCD